VSGSPRLLLATRSLVGVSLATRDRLLDVVARYREPESLAVTLSKAVGAGVDGVLASPLPVLLAAVAELKQTVPIYALLPALTEHERNDFEPGVEGLIERARGSAGLLARLRAGWSGLARPAALYRGDLARRLPLLIELEVARLSPRALKGVVLDACLTDLVLAAGKRAFFDSYCRFVRRRFGAAAGLETHNLGLLLARLREWDLRPDLVVGPLNPCGLMMKPSVAEVLDELKRTDVPVVAKELRAGGAVSLVRGAEFARSHGAYGLAPDLAEVEDVGTELRALGKG